MITVEDLKKIDACAGGIAAFRRAFPNVAESWMDVAEHPDCMPSWRGWIAANAPGLTFAERESLVYRSDDPAWRRGFIAANAPGLTLAERESLAERSNNPAYYRGMIAAYAPGLTLSERESLAERSDDPRWWRGVIHRKWGSA